MTLRELDDIIQDLKTKYSPNDEIFFQEEERGTCCTIDKIGGMMFSNTPYEKPIPILMGHRTVMSLELLFDSMYYRGEI